MKPRSNLKAVGFSGHDQGSSPCTRVGSEKRVVRAVIFSPFAPVSPQIGARGAVPGTSSLRFAASFEPPGFSERQGDLQRRAAPRIAGVDDPKRLKACLAEMPKFYFPYKNPWDRVSSPSNMSEATAACLVSRPRRWSLLHLQWTSPRCGGSSFRANHLGVAQFYTAGAQLCVFVFRKTKVPFRAPFFEPRQQLSSVS